MGELEVQRQPSVTAEPRPVPRVSTSSSPVPAMTPAPCTSASFPARVGTPRAAPSSPARSNPDHSFSSAGSGSLPGPCTVTKCGAVTTAAVADDTRETGQHPLERTEWTDEVDEVGDELAWRTRVGRLDPNPILGGFAVGTEHGGFES